MKLLARYVLFYCDDCDLLAPAIEAFMRINKFHTVLTSSDEKDFFSKIEEYTPEVLLIYLNNSEKNYMPLVKTIRDSPKASSIPLLTYKSLPHADELILAFRKIQSFED